MTDYPRPRVDDAPGLVWRKRVAGWEARWQARTDLKKLGFPIQYVRLWIGAVPTAFDAQYIQNQCRLMQGDMLLWGRGKLPTLGIFDGTLRGLIAAYQTDKDSTFQKLRFRTRETYMCLLRRLDQQHGDELLADIKARSLISWHDGWSATGHVSMAHSLVSMMRMLVNFGATILESAECERLSGVLHRMKFKMAKARFQVLTAEHVMAIRAKAHEMGLPSIALAQALQFELMLRQKDVIGEWVPSNEPGVSDVIDGNEKWLRGLKWSEIDGNLILRHTTSKRGKDIEVDLHNAPMVLEELPLIGERPTGPVIVYEKTGKPYLTYQFRRTWRQVADAAGVPRHIKNMDTRAGAITEATQAGADLEHIRHAATHGDISMTQRYARSGVEKTAKVMRLRVAGRNKTGT